MSHGAQPGAAFTQITHLHHHALSLNLDQSFRLTFANSFTMKEKAPTSAFTFKTLLN